MAPAAASEPPPPVSTMRKVFYYALNIGSGCAIVFTNKMVFATYKFKFVTTLTLIHTVFTCVGMNVLCRVGFFAKKELPPMSVAPLAFGYVGYVVLNNLSLNLNTVGFAQIMKIMMAPTVMLLEFFMFDKVPTPLVCMAVTVVCVGVGASTVTDKVAISNMMGLVVAVASVIITALYQIWAGTKQKDLQANSSQLLLAYTPQAIMMLVLLAPSVDPMGRPGGDDPHTVLGFPYTLQATAAIFLSACLGIIVTLSTFLVIGATSSLTFNMFGHIKTVLILSGGVILFGEHMPLGRFLGICVTMFGIVWYSWINVQQAAAGKSPVALEKALEKAQLDAEAGEGTPLLQPEQPKSSSGAGAGAEPPGAAVQLAANGHAAPKAAAA